MRSDVLRVRALVTFCSAHVRAAARLVLALLRELADENAYQRHLAAHRRPHSAVEWRLFSEARLNAKYGQPRCC